MSLPSLLEILSIFFEDLASKLPVKKGEKLKVTAGSHVAHDIETDVFDMIQKSYAGIGGHAKIKKPSDMGSEYPIWLVSDVDDDPEPDVALLGTMSKSGEKLGAVGTDGSSEGKAALFRLLKTFHQTPGNWSEVSGAMANILIKKMGFRPLDDEQKVRELLGNKKIVWTGTTNPEGDNLGVSGWYTRKIGDHEHSKIIVGNV